MYIYITFVHFFFYSLTLVITTSIVIEKIHKIKRLVDFKTENLQDTKYEPSSYICNFRGKNGEYSKIISLTLYGFP